MHNTAFAYGDHHPEVDWYDYKEEMEEPKPPHDPYLGLKVIKK